MCLCAYMYIYIGERGEAAKLLDFTAPGRGNGGGGGEAAVADDGFSSGRPSFVNVHDTGTRPVPPGPVAMVTCSRRRWWLSPPPRRTRRFHSITTPTRAHTHAARTRFANERARAYAFSLCAVVALRHTAPKNLCYDDDRRWGRQKTKDRWIVRTKDRAPPDKRVRGEVDVQQQQRILYYT